MFKIKICQIKNAKCQIKSIIIRQKGQLVASISFLSYNWDGFLIPLNKYFKCFYFLLLCLKKILSRIYLFGEISKMIKNNK